MLFPAISKVEGRCKKSKKYRGTPLVEHGSMERLDKITIMCTCRGIIFEVRYSNGSLCACGHLKVENTRQTFMCQEKLSSLDITINVSINHIKTRKERCDVSLYFDPFTDRAFIPRPIEIMRPLRPRPTKKLTPTARSASAERLVNSDEMIYIAPSKSLTIRSVYNGINSHEHASCNSFVTYCKRSTCYRQVNNEFAFAKLAKSC